MAFTTFEFDSKLAALSLPSTQQTLTDIKHGIEREALRVNPDGGLAITPHQKSLGSALTHDTITTDFSESLMEFITPPERDPQVTLSQLTDIHKFVYHNIDDEQLWPMSMPCFINANVDIPIARYGSSNIAKMKEVYRTGLKNRYGSRMQVIAGVHYNFSFPDSFWREWAKAKNQKHDKDFVSQEYFSLVRNFRKYAWLIPYLYGASPAICHSFIGANEKKYDFKKVGRGTLYLPYATSLRMSDLGYTNSEQSSLDICYNNVDDYIKSVKQAIKTPSIQYANLASGKNGVWEQLNANVLQIENELYSPIRPKQPIKPLEKPSDALADRGVSYIEVRALDVNPFTAIGISANQFYFLDVFLTWCLLQDSSNFTREDYVQGDQNLTQVVLQGRKPGLELIREGQSVPMKEWATSIFDELAQIASIFDSANNTELFSKAVAKEKCKVEDSDLTPSARVLAVLLAENLDNSAFGMRKADQYKRKLKNAEYRFLLEQNLVNEAQQSLVKCAEIEAADTLSFDDFIASYFKTKKMPE